MIKVYGNKVYIEGSKLELAAELLAIISASRNGEQAISAREAKDFRSIWDCADELAKHAEDCGGINNIDEVLAQATLTKYFGLPEKKVIEDFLEYASKHLNEEKIETVRKFLEQAGGYDA